MSVRGRSSAIEKKMNACPLSVRVMSVATIGWPGSREGLVRRRECGRRRESREVADVIDVAGDANACQDDLLSMSIVSVLTAGSPTGRMPKFRAISPLNTPSDVWIVDELSVRLCSCVQNVRNHSVQLIWRRISSLYILRAT